MCAMKYKGLLKFKLGRLIGLCLAILLVGSCKSSMNENNSKLNSNNDNRLCNEKLCLELIPQYSKNMSIDNFLLRFTTPSKSPNFSKIINDLDQDLNHEFIFQLNKYLSLEFADNSVLPPVFSHLEMDGGIAPCSTVLFSFDTLMNKEVLVNARIMFRDSFFTHQIIEIPIDYQKNKIYSYEKGSYFLKNFISGYVIPNI